MVLLHDLHQTVRRPAYDKGVLNGGMREKKGYIQGVARHGEILIQ